MEQGKHENAAYWYVPTCVVGAIIQGRLVVTDIRSVLVMHAPWDKGLIYIIGFILCS